MRFKLRDKIICKLNVTVRYTRYSHTSILLHGISILRMGKKWVDMHSIAHSDQSGQISSAKSFGLFAICSYANYLYCLFVCFLASEASHCALHTCMSVAASSTADPSWDLRQAGAFTHGNNLPWASGVRCIRKLNRPVPDRRPLSPIGRSLRDWILSPCTQSPSQPHPGSWIIIYLAFQR